MVPSLPVLSCESSVSVKKTGQKKRPRLSFVSTILRIETCSETLFTLSFPILYINPPENIRKPRFSRVSGRGVCVGKVVLRKSGLKARPMPMQVVLVPFLVTLDKYLLAVFLSKKFQKVSKKASEKLSLKLYILREIFSKILSCNTEAMSNKDIF